MNIATLRSARQLARSGDTERAWRLLEETGLIEVGDDPDVLSLKGRLFKDRALKAAGPSRSTFFGAAQDAYLQAAALRPATYPLINAASIALLDGQHGKAKQLAERTIAMLDGGDHEPETAYWLGATRAEAYLLLGRLRDARAALAKAVKQAPAAWEDHASTLRHFRLILNELDEPADWLDRHRPPASVHFSGVIHIAADESQAVHAIAAAVKAMKPGFAFGALAAGTDILAAEIMVGHGAELHVILPSTVKAFRRDSVLRFGKEWGPRFDALMAAAMSVDTIDTLDAVSEAGVILADEMGMGLAIRQAHILESTAVALRMGQSQRADGHRAVEEAWTRQRLPVRRIRIDRLAQDDMTPLPPFARDTIVGLPARVDPGVLLGAGGRADGVHAGLAMVRFADVSTAARAALKLAASAGREPPPVAVDYRARNPAEGEDDRFVMLAAMAAPGEVRVTRPTSLALGLAAPDIPCEGIGEVATPIGDIPVGVIG